MNYVAYIRCSTAKQDESGLGKEAQIAAVQSFIRADPSRKLYERLFEECESGTVKDRPQLKEAIAAARRTGGTLVIARLDRLTRNVLFLSNLLESGLPFVALDCPMADRTTLQMRAVFAEYEARLASERTIAGLAAAKARGQLLGSARPGAYRFTSEDTRRGRVNGHLIGAAAARKKADDAYLDLYPVLREQRAAGHGPAAIARYLNDRGFTTRTGGRWNHVMVSLTLRRADRLARA